MSTITAAALTVALLTTPPPTPGLHTTRSTVVLSWDYMRAWKQATPAAASTCAACHLVFAPRKVRRQMTFTSIGYGTPIPILPSAILFLSGVAAIASLNRRSK